MKSGDTIGGYTLTREVGRGGMGVVWEARRHDGVRAALKAIHPALVSDDTRARLSREMEAIAAVDTDFVAGVIDADIGGAQPFVATEFVDGPTLSEHVRARGPLSWAELAALGGRLGEGIAAVHAAGIVHRDLKPSNILLRDGSPVIIDFGIAHAVDAERMTSTGLVMGTPGYLAPEVLGGDQIGPEADWWGWAATMVFAATGRHPFGSGPPEVVMTRVHAGGPDLTGVPQPLVAVLGAALSRDPARRPSPGHLRVAVEQLAAAAPSEPDDPPTAVLPAGHTGTYFMVSEQAAPTPRSYAPQAGPPTGATSGQLAPGAPEAVVAGELHPSVARAARTLQHRGGPLFGAALWFVLIGIGTITPVVGALLTCAWIIIARAVSVSTQAMASPHAARRSRATNLGFAWVLAPVRLITSALASIPALLGAVAVGLIAGAATQLAVLALISDGLLNRFAATAAMSAVMTFMAWHAGGRNRVRHGTHVITETFTRSTSSTLVVTLLLGLMVISLLQVTFVSDDLPRWLVLGEAPWSALTEMFM